MNFPTKVWIYGAMFAFLVLVLLFSQDSISTEALTPSVNPIWFDSTATSPSVPGGGVATIPVDSLVPMSATGALATAGLVGGVAAPAVPTGSSVTTAATTTLSAATPSQELNPQDMKLFTDSVVDLLARLPPLTLQITSQAPLLGCNTKQHSAATGATANAAAAPSNSTVAGASASTASAATAAGASYEPFYRPPDSLAGSPSAYASNYVPSYSRSLMMAAK